MTAALIRDFERAVISLTAHDDTLHVTAAQGTLTPEIRQRLIDAKAELLPLVRIRDRLLAIAHELGLPDALVLELPASELQATAEQSTWYADVEIAHRLLTFYLRSLAGVEPALPGTVAERHQAERQARVRALRRRT